MLHENFYGNYGGAALASLTTVGSPFSRSNIHCMPPPQGSARRSLTQFSDFATERCE